MTTPVHSHGSDVEPPHPRALHTRRARGHTENESCRNSWNLTGRSRAYAHAAHAISVFPTPAGPDRQTMRLWAAAAARGHADCEMPAAAPAAARALVAHQLLVHALDVRLAPHELVAHTRHAVHERRGQVTVHVVDHRASCDARPHPRPSPSRAPASRRTHACTHTGRARKRRNCNTAWCRQQHKLSCLRGHRRRRISADRLRRGTTHSATAARLLITLPYAPPPPSQENHH